MRPEDGCFRRGVSLFVIITISPISCALKIYNTEGFEFHLIYVMPQVDLMMAG